MNVTLLIFLIIGIVIVAMMLVCIYMCYHFLRSLNENRVRDITTALKLTQPEHQWVWSQWDADVKDGESTTNIDSRRHRRRRPKRNDKSKLAEDDIDSITNI